MRTQCTAEQLEFAGVGRRRVVAAFDGGTVSSDAGALLLGKADRAIGLIDRLAGCFRDGRSVALVEHSVRTLVGQRVFGLALGYEDLNDHEQLRHDPVMGALLGKLEAGRRSCAPLAGKSTLNRLELHARSGTDRYHKIVPQTDALERLWVELFLEAHRRAPPRIVLDLDATDDPLHGNQEGRFFHGYYNHYCYLPLYIFCGEHLLLATLRPANIDGAAGAKEAIERIVAQIRARWPKVQIVLRADSGFCREPLMRWCEENTVDYVLGLARNARLTRAIGRQLRQARAEADHSGRPGVAPLSWTPQSYPWRVRRWRSPRWRTGIQPSFGSRWSSWCERAESPNSWRRNLAVRTGRSRPGSGRPSVTRVAAMAG